MRSTSVSVVLLLSALAFAQSFEGDNDYVETDDNIGRPLGPEDFANADNEASLYIPGEFSEDWHFEDDMILGNGTAEDRTGFYEGWYNIEYWTDGVVPYAIADDYTTNERALVAKAIQAMEKHTCVRQSKQSHRELCI